MHRCDQLTALIMTITTRARTGILAANHNTRVESSANGNKITKILSDLKNHERPNCCLRDDQLRLHCDHGTLSGLPLWDRHQPSGETIHFSISAQTQKFITQNVQLYMKYNIQKYNAQNTKNKKTKYDICSVLQRWSNLWDANEWFACSHFVERQGCIFFP